MAVKTITYPAGPDYPESKTTITEYEDYLQIREDCGCCYISFRAVNGDAIEIYAQNKHEDEFTFDVEGEAVNALSDFLVRKLREWKQ